MGLFNELKERIQSKNKNKETVSRGSVSPEFFDTPNFDATLTKNDSIKTGTRVPGASLGVALDNNYTNEMEDYTKVLNETIKKATGVNPVVDEAFRFEDNIENGVLSFGEVLKDRFNCDE